MNHNTYTTAYHGFAASLTLSQAESLRRSDSVLGVYLDTLDSLHTIRTSEFLRLNPQLGLWAGHTLLQLYQASQDVVVGVLGTGVWPESKSFDDSGMPDLPAKWKGECESGPDFKPTLCNEKLSGARRPMSLLGYAQVANASGTARRMAINASLATYKICWKTGCFGSDILAGMDWAILDGVDVLSLSLGGGSAQYHRDAIVIGAFTAADKGIFVSCSAGNSGPGEGSLANVAPWIMTVGAGTIDRDFPAYAVMGDGKRFTGVSLYSGKGMGKKPVGLVYSTGKNSSSNLCLRGSLEPDVVRGKLVLCDRGINARVEKGLVVRDAGGVGVILANTAETGEELVVDSHLLPAVAVGRKVGDLIRDYVGKDVVTVVLSFGGTVLNVRPSPVVAAFSSRGPNMVTQQVLKPDVIAPGVEILAGWSEAIGLTGLDQDTRKTQFNIMSGVWIEGAVGRLWDLICGLGEQESSLNTPFRSGIDPTVAIFASAALPVKRPSKGSKNSIEVPRQHQSGCGCKHPCKCNPCHCNGSGIDPTVAIFASAALPVKRPSKGSKNSIEVPRQHQSGCGCKHPCKCNPCHCNGFAIDPNTVTLVASVAPPVLMMPSEGSKKSIKADHGSCSEPHDMKK